MMHPVPNDLSEKIINQSLYGEQKQRRITPVYVTGDNKLGTIYAYAEVDHTGERPSDLHANPIHGSILISSKIYTNMQGNTVTEFRNAFGRQGFDQDVKVDDPNNDVQLEGKFDRFYHPRKHAFLAEDEKNRLATALLLSVGYASKMRQWLTQRNDGLKRRIDYTGLAQLVGYDARLKNATEELWSHLPKP